MMKPYYETENGKLYHGDCLEIMPQLESVDLVLTDPNYGIGEAAGKNNSRDSAVYAEKWKNSRNTTGVGIPATQFDYMTWDNEIPPKTAFDQMMQISKHQIIFGGNYFVEYLYNSPAWIVWNKDNGGTDFADCELAWTNFNTAVRMFKYRWNGMLQECMGYDKEIRFHPTQKPVGLFAQILLKYANKGETVMDPFAGSGTTALACERIGNLSWVLIEKEEKYCEIAAKRIENETRQLKFDFMGAA